ncbi:MAG: Sulfite exporter TauE/SafE, partial [Akkermansiaceae bacterium]|nr:Sulfite exporter TauE/SafE [Akkermansiaceae bacterium]
MSKSGFSGISLISVFLFADLYGAKASVGLALPLLIVADLTVYPTFHKHGSWAPVWKMLPAVLVGLGLGWWLLNAIPEHLARKSIGG